MKSIQTEQVKSLVDGGWKFAASRTLEENCLKDLSYQVLKPKQKTPITSTSNTTTSSDLPLSPSPTSDSPHPPGPPSAGATIVGLPLRQGALRVHHVAIAVVRGVGAVIGDRKLQQRRPLERRLEWGRGAWRSSWEVFNIFQRLLFGLFGLLMFFFFFLGGVLDLNNIVYMQVKVVHAPWQIDL